ncbi:unnamed protein product [Spodoptera exigua]|nr:unnamed protein product [Spodoptera exigua]
MDNGNTKGVVAAAGGVGACAGRRAEGRGGAARPRCLTRPRAAARLARHDHIVLSQQLYREYADRAVVQCCRCSCVCLVCVVSVLVAAPLGVARTPADESGSTHDHRRVHISSGALRMRATVFRCI